MKVSLERRKTMKVMWDQKLLKGHVTTSARGVNSEWKDFIQ